MPKETNAPRKKYPPKVADTGTRAIIKRMLQVSYLDSAFHLLMAILLITGLLIDLLGSWLGGWLFWIRQVAHGYLGTLFVIIFILYILKALVSKKMRTVLTVTNYVDFLFYIALIITGISIASANAPWITYMPELAEALAPIAAYAPTIHIVGTYVWILFSTIFPGGILHGLATAYLISHLKKRSERGP
jgi:hypothetical protein